MSNQSIDTAGVVSLKYVLASLKSALSIDDREDERLLQFIVDGVSEINMFHLDISGTKKGMFDITQINTVDLPSDFIDYIVIGRVINGRIVSLSRNEALAIPIDIDCGLDANPYKDAIVDFPKFYHYGLGGGYNIAEYRIDKRDRRIIISGVVPGSQIYMEYISTGVSLNEETVIPRYAVPVLRAYADWKRTEYDDKKPLYDKQRKAMMYQFELERADSLVNSMTVDEILDQVYKGYRQTPKR
jgi:hypothetical protein